MAHSWHGLRKVTILIGTYLARRMQGVHFLTKCQPLSSLAYNELARRMQGVHFLTKCQPLDPDDPWLIQTFGSRSLASGRHLSRVDPNDP